MRPICVWCVQPETNLVRPRLDSSRTLPCCPLSPGEHEEETAPTHEVNPPVRTHDGGTLAMDLIDPCRAGLDVHKKTVVACIRRAGPDGQVGREVRTDRTMT